MSANVENKTGVDVRRWLKKQGYSTLPSDWYDKIEEWRSWYKGKVDSFHSYKQFNGSVFVQRTRKTLGMAKKVSEDKADLLLNDRCEINVSPQNAQKYLDDVLDDTLFWPRGNQLVELASALGSGAFVEYLSRGKIEIDCVPADCCFPLAWNNGEVTESAFASEVNTVTGRVTYVNIHRLAPTGNYYVENHMLDCEGKEIELPAGLLPEFDTKSDTPLFQYIKPAGVNNYDSTIPMGVSVFANAIDILKGVDLVYDSYCNEFQLGKKRIFVRDSATRVKAGPDGVTFVPVFDPNDTEFYAFDMKETDDPIHEIDMNLRAEPHEIALQRNLDLLSEKCGFGKGYYQATADSVQTATGVISQNSQLFRRIRKDEIILEHALKGLVSAVFVLGGQTPPQEINISFDDSIVEDTDAESKRALLEVQAGVISHKRYLMNVYDLTEKQADALVKEAADEAGTSTEPDPGNLFPEQPGDGEGDGEGAEGPQDGAGGDGSGSEG
jgi:A118 family predicted phage portal protein